MAQRNSLSELLIEKGMGLLMDAGKSVTRALGGPTGKLRTVPQAIYCLYFGEVQMVNQETARLAKCPNCLDEAFFTATRRLLLN